MSKSIMIMFICFENRIFDERLTKMRRMRSEMGIEKDRVQKFSE